MVKLWKYISYLGLKGDSKSTDGRSVILTNRINFLIIVLLVIFIIVTSIVRFSIDGPYTLHTKKLAILLVLCLPNLLFSYIGLHNLVKINLTFVPPLVLVFLPIFMGEIQELDFMQAPIYILGLSLIPQMILKPDLKSKSYVLSFFFYLSLTLLIDESIIYFSSQKYSMVESTVQFRIYYKLILVSIFIFIFITLYYLRSQNSRYENELVDYNEELNAALDELKSIQNRLIHSEKMASLGTLIAGVAHEINNPLNYINGGIQVIYSLKQDLENTIEDGYKNKCEKALKMLDSGLERAMYIVKTLTTFSYKESLNPVKADIHSIIENTLMFLNSKLTTDIRVLKKFQLTQEVPIYPEKMHQVFLNIIDNAIFAVKESIKEEKEIVISTEQKDNECIIEVYNNGPHIDEKQINRLFDPFFTTKDVGIGTGLGLSICYSLIEDHKGTIEVINKEEGVVFSILLPL